MKHFCCQMQYFRDDPNWFIFFPYDNNHSSYFTIFPNQPGQNSFLKNGILFKPSYRYSQRVCSIFIYDKYHVKMVLIFGTHRGYFVPKMVLVFIIFKLDQQPQFILCTFFSFYCLKTWNLPSLEATQLQLRVCLIFLDNKNILYKFQIKHRFFPPKRYTLTVC